MTDTYSHNFELRELASSISGYVYDESSGEMLDNVSIYVYEMDENGNYNRQFYSNKPISTGDTNSQIQIYTGVGDGIFVKPNEILDRNLVPSGNYILQFDFLRDSSGSDNTLQTGYFINEISPSRKEVRLLDDLNIIADRARRLITKVINIKEILI